MRKQSNSPCCPSLQTQEREHKKCRKKHNSICQIEKRTHPAVPLFKHKRGNIRNAGRNVTRSARSRKEKDKVTQSFLTREINNI